MSQAKSMIWRASVAPRRAERPAIVVVDFSYGFTDTAYPTAANMSRRISPATRRLTNIARDAGFPVIYTTYLPLSGRSWMPPWLRKPAAWPPCWRVRASLKLTLQPVSNPKIPSS